MSWSKLWENDCLRELGMRNEMVPLRVRWPHCCQQANRQMVRVGQLCVKTTAPYLRHNLRPFLHLYNALHSTRFCPDCRKLKSDKSDKEYASEQNNYKIMIENALMKLAKKKKGEPQVKACLLERSCVQEYQCGCGYGSITTWLWSSEVAFVVVLARERSKKSAQWLRSISGKTWTGSRKGCPCIII